MAAIFIVAAAAGLAGCGADAGLESSGGEPLLTVAPNPVDLGFVGSFGTVNASFTITNPTGAPIKIDRIRASCDCTFPDVQNLDLRLPPGASITVPIDYDPAGKRGSQQVSISIVYNGGSRTLWTELLAQIADEIEPSEPAWSLEIGRGATGQELAISLFAAGDAGPFAITAIETPDFLTSLYSETLYGTPDFAHSLAMRAADGMDLGHHSGTIRVTTTNERNPVVQIPAHLVIAETLIASRASIFLHRLDPESPIPAEISIRRFDGADFSIRKVETATANVQVDYAAEPGAERVITITFHAPEGGGSVRDLLRVEGDPALGEILEIPVGASFAGR